MKMFYKKDNILVDVYSFEEKSALVYNPSYAGRNNGYGWMRVSYKHLVPQEYWNPNNTPGFESKSDRNKIGHRLVLKSAVWECTDGKTFSDYDEAITHEKMIMSEEIVGN